MFQWQEKICNKRKHGTTKQVPDAVFESQEKSKLKQLPKKAWGVCIYIRRKVSTTCHVTVESNYYSVPYKQI
ncbi:hypothetical protein H8D83_02150 [Candidatus Woesearchaeota archaeon]|nr:hypothetical protein [Candidatus Woesearchaeota archaeon]